MQTNHKINGCTSQLINFISSYLQNIFAQTYHKELIFSYSKLSEIIKLNLFLFLSYQSQSNTLRTLCTTKIRKKKRFELRYCQFQYYLQHEVLL